MYKKFLTHRPSAFVVRNSLIFVCLSQVLTEQNEGFLINVRYHVLPFCPPQNTRGSPLLYFHLQVLPDSLMSNVLSYDLSSLHVSVRRDLETSSRENSKVEWWLLTYTPSFDGLLMDFPVHYDRDLKCVLTLYKYKGGLTHLFIRLSTLNTSNTSYRKRVTFRRVQDRLLQNFVHRFPTIPKI